MMKINFIIIVVIFLFVNTQCSIFLQKNKQQYADEIIDVFEAEICCGETEGIISNLIYMDTMIYDTIKGFANFIVTFDSVDSLNIKSVKLRCVYLRYPENTIIHTMDSRYQYFNLTLVALFEKYKCWKKVGDLKEIFSVNQSIVIPFIIMPYSHPEK